MCRFDPLSVYANRQSFLRLSGPWLPPFLVPRTFAKILPMTSACLEPTSSKEADLNAPGDTTLRGGSAGLKVFRSEGHTQAR